MTLPRDYPGLAALEWLETNGLGGYAMGTVAGAGTRGYHGLLAAAVEPPAVRTMIVTGMDEWLVQPNAFLSTQQYPGTVSPEGYKLLESFEPAPMPTWVFKSGGTRVERRVFMVHGENTIVVRYRLLVGKPVTLAVRPFFVWRDHHARREATEHWWVAASRAGDAIHCAPSDGGIPVSVYAHPTSRYRDEPLWYRRFEYQRELERGLAGHEDAFAPFVVELALSRDQDAALTFTTDMLRPAGAGTLERDELERRAKIEGRLPAKDPVARRLAVAADHFLVVRSGGQRSVIAGYPWFTDWGRDTMIALPGLALETGALDEAALILKSFAAYLADGLLPNRFPDQAGSAEYNTIDASLWFIVAVHRFVAAGGNKALVRDVLLPAVEAIVRAYERGTHFEIHEDSDGLVSGGVDGLALTWMDARVGDWVVTPRVGKPVEINALWYNARRILTDLLEAHGRGNETTELKDRAAVTKAAFTRVFWDPKTKSLVDLVNGGVTDRSIRPNQVFAASLPYPLLEPAEAGSMLACVTKHLLTPKGLRTLASSDPKYMGAYAGSVETRDAAYHQGTVWPWLLGPYVDALLHAKGDSAATRAEARKVLAPLVEHLDGTCLGQVSEIFDGAAPHTPRGCPAQAWSVAELLRAWRRVNAEQNPKAAPKLAPKPAPKPKAAKKPAKPKPPGKGKKRG